MDSKPDYRPGILKRCIVCALLLMVLACLFLIAFGGSDGTDNLYYDHERIEVRLKRLGVKEVWYGDTVVSE